jgi:hypothetical protein
MVWAAFDILEKVLYEAALGIYVFVVLILLCHHLCHLFFIFWLVRMEMYGKGFHDTSRCYLFY